VSVALLTTAVFGLPAQASAATAKTAKQISAAEAHACALISDGTVSCWGSNYFGQLGNGTTDDSNRPVPVSGVSGATRVAVGGDFSCALLKTGLVKCWGSNEFNQLGSPSGVNKSLSTRPIQVEKLTLATDISAGYNHACALLKNGSIVCWGYNGSGQLGRGEATDEGYSSPTAISGLTGATSVSAGQEHTCAVVAGGQVKCWGDNSYGQLGTDGSDDLIPSTVVGLSKATAVSAKYRSTCALAEGKAFCWGSRIGPAASGSQSGSGSAAAVTGVAGATQLSLGYNHACVLATKAAVLCWGDNADGQLGNGTTTATRTPTKVGSLAGLSIAAGSGFTCSGLTVGGIKCWGTNQNGELGNGRDADSKLPSTVAFSAPPAPPTISSGPAAWSNQSTVVIKFTAKTDKTFRCSVDEGAYKACKSPLTLKSLTNGDHSLTILHASKAGVESSVTVDWAVDTVKPSLSSSVVLGTTEGVQTSFDLLEQPDDSEVVTAEYSTATKAPSATAAPVAAKLIAWDSPLVIPAVGIKFLRVRDGAGNWSAWYAVTYTA